MEPTDAQLERLTPELTYSICEAWLLQRVSPKKALAILRGDPLFAERFFWSSVALATEWTTNVDILAMHLTPRDKRLPLLLKTS